MIDILLPNPPTKFAEYVVSYNGGISTHHFNNYNVGTEKTKILKECKSFKLGAYPPNCISEKHYK